MTDQRIGRATEYECTLDNHRNRRKVQEFVGRMDFHDLKELIAILASEREFARQELIPKKKSLGRRVLTHLVFADCEAISYYLKDSINSDYAAKGLEGKVDTGEWLASMGDQHLITDDGGVCEREKQFRTLPHLLFVLKYTAKYIDKTFDPKRIVGWQHVKSVFDVRNRITHPKEPASLKITEEDLRHIEALEKWLQVCLETLTN